MDRIDSAASTLSDLNIAPIFTLGDRVRRQNTFAAGTVRYVGPLLHGTAASSSSSVSATAASSASAALAGGTSSSSTETSSSRGTQQMMMVGSSGSNSTENSRPTAQQPALDSTLGAASVDSLQELVSPNSQHQQQQQSSGAASSPVAAAAAAALASDPAQPIYLGVEWDTPNEGKNDGQVQGVRYFSCDPLMGSLLPTKNVQRGIPLCRALEARYGSSTVRQDMGQPIKASATKPMQLGPAIGRRDESGAFINVVSSDASANEQLRLISCVGEGLCSLFPNLRDLSVAGTLIADWREIARICELPSLESLDVSRNRPLACPSTSEFAKERRERQGERQPLSVTVKELKMSDLQKMLPECLNLILSEWFPSLGTLYCARNGISLDGNPLLAAPVPPRRAFDADQQHSRDASGSLLLSTASSAAAATSAASHLTYLNLEGNPLQELDDVARLIGSDHCCSLTALNVSSTNISDSILLPEMHPRAVLARLENSSPGGSTPAAKSPQKSPSSGGRAVVVVGNDENPDTNNNSSNSNSNSNSQTACSSSSSGLGQQHLQQLITAEPPLFPRLTSLYLNKVPVTSWAALSRILHRAASMAVLNDVHFTTSSQDHRERAEGFDDDDDDNEDMASDTCTSNLEEQGCFLPEDFRDRRRLTVAFMPPGVKKLNRSEITTVERATAMQRSIDEFARLVKKSLREEREAEMKRDLEEESTAAGDNNNNNSPKPQQQQQQDDIFDGFSSRRFGQLPFHLQKSIAQEYRKRGEAQEGKAGGPGFIYRPQNSGPRKMQNEIEINMRVVFLQTKEHLSNLENEHPPFASVLNPGESGGAGEKAALLRASSSSITSTASSGGGSSSGDVLPLVIDVRWETQRLQEAVVQKLGCVSSKIQLIHVDKELAENPGARARRMHLKKLNRPWEKLHMSRIAENDDLIVAVGP